MLEKIKKIKIRKADGSFSDYIPIGVDANNVDLKNGNTLEDELNQKIYYFNTVADMKANSKLKNGDTVYTLGYYETNDGNSGLYNISNKNKDTSIKLNNELFANKIDNIAEKSINLSKISDNMIPTIRKCASLVAKNCIWSTLNSNGLQEGHYGYKSSRQISIEKGRECLKAEIDDLKSMGVEEIFPVIYVIRNNGSFIISGGENVYLEDLLWVKNYCDTIEMKCDLFRVMQDTNYATIFTENEKTTYKQVLTIIANKFKNKFKRCIILNELETMLNSDDDKDFGIECINIMKDKNFLTSISISNRSSLRKELLNNVDFISYNLYEPIQFDTEKIVHLSCADMFEDQKTRIKYFSSFGKEVVISECGCRDCYWSLGNPAGSSVPEGYYNYTYGKAISHLLDGIFDAIGNLVTDISIWYSQGFNYHDNNEDSKICRDINKKVIQRWVGVK